MSSGDYFTIQILFLLIFKVPILLLEIGKYFQNIIWWLNHYPYNILQCRFMLPLISILSDILLIYWSLMSSECSHTIFLPIYLYLYFLQFLVYTSFELVSYSIFIAMLHFSSWKPSYKFLLWVKLVNKLGVVDVESICSFHLWSRPLD